MTTLATDLQPRIQHPAIRQRLRAMVERPVPVSKSSPPGGGGQPDPVLERAPSGGRPGSGSQPHHQGPRVREAKLHGLSVAALGLGTGDHHLAQPPVPPGVGSGVGFGRPRGAGWRKPVGYSGPPPFLAPVRRIGASLNKSFAVPTGGRERAWHHRAPDRSDA